MDAPRKVVSLLGRPHTRDAGSAVPVSLVLRLQQVVGNREVNRYLTPRPIAQSPAQVSTAKPSGGFLRLGAGGAAGAVAGAGFAVAGNLSTWAGAACALAGLIVGSCSAWMMRKRAPDDR